MTRSTLTSFAGRQWDLREVISTLFRRKRPLIFTFLVVLAAGVLYVLIAPAEYEAQLKVLIKRQMPATSAMGIDAETLPTRTLTDKDVASAVDLMKNRDLLRDVVIATGMQKPVKRTFWNSIFGTSDEKTRRADLVSSLEKQLKVDPPTNTDLIRVRYTNSDPQMAADVLNALGRIYVQKYVEVNRATGPPEFYEEQAEKALQELTAAHERLVDFSRQQGVVAAEDEKRAALHKLADFVATLQQTNALIADSKNRIAALENQLSGPQGRDYTTSQNFRSELAFLRVELAGLEGRARSTQATVDRYRNRLAQLGVKGVAQQQLLQQAKQAENNYVAALTRQETAKASLAMEAEGITNVAIAEAAAVPYARSWKPWKTLALFFVIAVVAALLVAFSLDMLDTRIHTPEQLATALGLPVLAAFTQQHGEETERDEPVDALQQESWA